MTRSRGAPSVQQESGKLSSEDQPRDGKALADCARRNVQLLAERARQAHGTADALAEPRATETVGIVGAGMMGTAIAAVNVKGNLPVVITDTNREVLDDAPNKILAEFADIADWSLGDAARAIRRLVQPTTDDEAIARCDLVVEAVIETIVEKQQVYARLEPQLAAEAVLATNTSTITIGKLAAGLADPGRFCGLHFLHPVRHRTLIEVIRGPHTREQTIARAVEYVKSVGKMAIVVNDCPGFLVNRLLLPYMNEALELLLEGATIEAIEGAAAEFGMPCGPLTAFDEIGMDTAIRSGRVLWEAFPDRVVANPLIVSMYKSGRRGRKTGTGFFRYGQSTDKCSPARVDPSVYEIIAGWARPPKKHTPETIIARLLLPSVVEATRILEEKIVADPRDVDIGMLFGLAFPADRGGLLYWADTLGAEQIVRMLGPLEELGQRYQPTPMLLEMAAENRRFYDLT